MSFIVGSIVAKLEMDIKGWKESIQKVENDQKSLSGSIIRNKDQIEGMGRALAIAGTAIVGAFSAMAVAAARYGDNLMEISQKVGVNVTQLSGYKLAADKTGMSIDGLAKGLKFLSVHMVEANNGNKAAVALFKNLGVSVTDASGKLRKTDDVLADVSESFSTMEGGAEKTTLAVKTFGKSGMDMIPFLNLGADGLKREREEAERLGLVLSGPAAAAQDAFADQLDTLKDAGQGVAITIGTIMIPALKGVVDGMINLTAGVTAAAKSHPELVKAIGSTAMALGVVGMALGSVMMILPKLASGLNTLRAVLATTTVGVGLFTVALTAGVGVIIYYISKLSELSDAEDRTIEATEQLRLTENILVDQLSAAAVAAHWQFGRMSELITAYDGNIAALTVAIKKGKEGVDIQKALAEVGKKHADALKKQKEGTEGLSTATQELNEKLGLTLKIDLEKKYKEMLVALQQYKGQLTVPAERKLIDDLIALRAELDNIKPSVVSLSDTMKTFDETLAGIMTDAEVEAINQGFQNMAKDSQLAFEDATSGIVTDILGIVGPAEVVEAKFKMIGDAMGVSANTVKIAMWNIQVDFLRTIGIILPKIQSLAPSTQATTKSMNDYFTGLFNDIATGFGNTIQKWLEGATTFKNFLEGLWENVKSSFFRMIGEMIAKWVVDFVGGLIKGAVSAASGVAGSMTAIGTTISSLVGTVGAVLTTLVTTIGTAIVTLATAIATAIVTLATGVASAATIIAAAAPAIIVASLIGLGIYATISLLKRIIGSGGGTGAGDGMGRVVERQDVQTGILTMIRDTLNDNIKTALWIISSKQDKHKDIFYILSHKLDLIVSALKTSNTFLDKIAQNSARTTTTATASTMTTAKIDVGAIAKSTLAWLALIRKELIAILMKTGYVATHVSIIRTYVTNPDLKNYIKREGAFINTYFVRVITALNKIISTTNSIGSKLTYINLAVNGTTAILAAVIKDESRYIRKSISDLGVIIKNLSSAQSGAISTKPELMMIHGTPSDPEYIFRKSSLPIERETYRESITMTIPIMLDGTKMDERILKISNGRVEWLHNQYLHGNRLIPAKTVGGV